MTIQYTKKNNKNQTKTLPEFEWKYKIKTDRLHTYINVHIFNDTEDGISEEDAAEEVDASFRYQKSSTRTPLDELTYETQQCEGPCTLRTKTVTCVDRGEENGSIKLTFEGYLDTAAVSCWH